MAKIIYSQLGKPKKKCTKPLKNPTAHLYIGGAPYPVKNLGKVGYASLTVNIGTIAALIWEHHAQILSLLR